MCAGICNVAGQMQAFVDICRASYSIQDEDTANYGVGWTDLPETAANNTQVCHKTRRVPVRSFLPRDAMRKARSLLSSGVRLCVCLSVRHVGVLYPYG